MAELFLRNQLGSLKVFTRFAVASDATQTKTDVTPFGKTLWQKTLLQGGGPFGISIGPFGILMGPFGKSMGPFSIFIGSICNWDPLATWTLWQVSDNFSR